MAPSPRSGPAALLSGRGAKRALTRSVPGGRAPQTSATEVPGRTSAGLLGLRREDPLLHLAEVAQHLGPRALGVAPAQRRQDAPVAGQRVRRPVVLLQRPLARLPQQ